MQILKIMDEMQRACGKNRMVIVLDGMGTAIIRKMLSPDGFFTRHLTGCARAIVPATTVAATTAYRTGKMPYETGFIGWSQYFAEVDEVIEVFLNTNYYTGAVSKLAQHPNTLPIPRVVERMMNSGRRAFEIMPAFAPDGCATFEDWLARIADVCNRETDAYIYAYWTEPDSALHRNGTNDAGVRDMLRDMERRIEQTLAQIKNKTDILITADHGHHDLNHFFVDDFPDVAACLMHPLSVEARCASLFVWPEKLAEFPEIFNRHFGAHFKLVPKAEFERDYLYATHPVRFVGDFVALAVGDWGLCQNRDVQLWKSNHAGITDDEMEIPLIRVTVD